MEDVTGCPDHELGEKVADYARGMLSPEESREVEKHLTICPYCSRFPILKCVDPDIGYWVPFFQLGEVKDKELKKKCAEHIFICKSCRQDFIESIPVMHAFNVIREYHREHAGSDLKIIPEVERILRQIIKGQDETL